MANSPDYVLHTLPEHFFRGVIDDLQKLSYSFLDEKRWVDAGDYLTQSLILFDCIKRAGYHKRDDNQREENTLLLRAACGLKLGAFDVAFKDATRVLESTLDNRHALEIRTLAEGEMSINEFQRSGMSFPLRGKMEKVRRDIEKLSEKPFQWDKSHIDRLSKRLEDILGPKPEVKPQTGSWASRVSNQPRAATPDVSQETHTVDKGWLPKTAIPKQHQPQKPPKGKKKGRSRRQNRPRKDVEVTYSEQDDDDEEEEDETDSEMNTSGSTTSSPGGTPERGIAGLDDFGVSPPASKTHKNHEGLSDLDVDLGYRTPKYKHKPPQKIGKHPQTPQPNMQRAAVNGQRPAVNGQRPVMNGQRPVMNGQQRSSPINGAVPKASPQVPKSQSLTTFATCPPPPTISAESRQWLAGHEFRLACEICFTPVPNQFGIYSFRLNRNPGHKPACKGGMLVCLLRVPPKNGLREVYGRIRPRVKQDFKGRYALCQQFAAGIPCKISSVSCWFPHSNEEMEVWEADRNGRFNGREIVTWLRYELNKDIFEMKQQAIAKSKATSQAPQAPGAYQNKAPTPAGAVPPGTKGSAPPPGAYPSAQKGAQAPGAYPHATLLSQNGFQQPPAVIRTAPPLLPTPSPQPSQGPPPPLASRVLDPQVREKLTILIKNLGGQFLYLCRLCFDDAPQVLSVQNSSNPDICTGEKRHKWNGPNRCLVHRLCQGGRDRYWKIRKRPNGIPPKAFLCWHRDKTYGCPIGPKCSFAHNEIETCLWLYEAYQPLDREMLVRVSHELIYGPPVQARPAPSKPAPTHASAPTPATAPFMQQQAAPTLQQPQRLIFHYKIKLACGLCFTKTKQVVEQNPRKRNQCPKGHPWGKNPIYFLESSGRWLRIQGRHPRLRPEVEPVVCRKGDKCQYSVIHNNQCMYPHSPEERLLWIYQVKAKAKSIDEVIAIQKQAAAGNKSVPNAGGDGGAAAAAASAGPAKPSSFPQQMMSSHYLCSYCDKPFRTKQNYDEHTNTMEHKRNIKSDTERSWKYRSVPLNVTNGQFKICQRNLRNVCDYSGVVQERNDCAEAHSQEELEEWKERHEYRMMKIAKAKEQKLYSFVDELLAEYNQSSNAEYDVMTEEIPGISTICSKDLKAILPVKERKYGEEIAFQWEFEVQSVRKSLRRVGLLYDEHRLHFHLSQPDDENRPQVCPGGLISEVGGTSYKIKIEFHTHILGLFHQWVVFDFGEKPVLLRKLSIHVGSSNELEKFAKQQQTREKIKLWDSGNSQIIPFTKPDIHEWERQLIAHYKQPTTLSGLEDEETDRRLNEENYKLHMHRMLNLEELACMDRLIRYSTSSEMSVSNQADMGYPYGTLFASNGELFGTIKIEVPLYDDSETSQIVRESVSQVLLKFNQESDVVYEAVIIKNAMPKDQSDDYVCVKLSAQCVQEQNLTSFVTFSGDKAASQKVVPVIIQFQLDRINFVYQHHAVDNLNCMTVLFPPYPQQGKFENVSWREVESRDEKMNPRQEKAARFICSAGGLRGNSHFRGKGPVIIFGPFGTGKTYTMANSVKRTMLVRNDSRILICTRSNSAADLYITEHLDEFCSEHPGTVYMVRMYSVTRQTGTIHEKVMKYVLKDDQGNLRHPYDQELSDWATYAKTQTESNRRTPNIVIATLSTAIHLTRNLDLKEYFTHIIIDEAGQVRETQAIIPLQLATNDTCVVLAGDHKQISPKVYSPRARSAKFNVSLLQRLFTYSRDHRCSFDLLLTYNYRSCKEILDFLASYYRARLEARGTHPRHPLFYPLNFYVVKGEDKLMGTSYVNLQEMLEVAFRVDDLVQNWPPAWGPVDDESIAVLTPYTLQVHIIRKELRRRGLGQITVDTVQNVQGKQFRAVVISTVRTRETVNKAHITAIPQASGNHQENEFYYAFLSDERLLNTAFTRAKSLILVVGDPVALCSVGACHMTWVRYMHECQKNNSIMPPDMTMDMIQEEIAAAKQRLNPTAAPFQPRKGISSSTTSTASSKTHQSASASNHVGGSPSRWTDGNSIWSRSTRNTRSSFPAGATAGYQRLNSDEYPELPELNHVQNHAQNTLHESDEEDEFEDTNEFEDINIQDDDLLEELRLQVKVDYQEEMKKSGETIESPESGEGTESEPETSPEPEETPPPQILQRGKPVPAPLERRATQREADSKSKPQRETVKQATQTLPTQQPQTLSTGQPSKPDVDISIPTDGNIPSFRMVERAGRIALLPRHMPQRALSQVEDYDSDEDEAHGVADEKTEDDFLEKTVTEPEKFKVCTFRYDLKGRTEAIPHERAASEVISITSKKRRGQALDNDEVVVEIVENTEGTEELEGVDLLVKEEEENRIYGKVVHILKRDSDPYLRKLVCTLDPFSNNLMVPVDRTFPKLFITKTEDKAEESRDKNLTKVTIHTISRAAAQTQGRFTPDRDVYVNNKERPHKLFVVRFWKWYAKTPYPLGVVIEELEPGMNPREGLHILKLIHNVKDKFKDSVNAYLRENFPVGWTIPKADLEKRVDLTKMKIFTIDPPDSEDLDDAVSLEPISGNCYSVGIHIADVSYFVPKGSDLDEEARIRSTSFYPSFHEKPIHMLPKKISTDLCSLHPNKDRLALSLIVVLNSDGVLVEPPNVFRTIIRSCHKLTYHQAEEIIHGDCPDELQDVAEPIRCLHNLASRKRAHRLGDKKYVFNAEDDDGEVQDPLAHSLIEEMMVLANEIVADHLLLKYADCTPLRRQLAPAQDKVEEWRKTHKDGVRNSILLTATVNQDQEEDVDYDDDDDDEAVLPLTQPVWEEIIQASNENTQKSMDKVINMICMDPNHPLQAVALSQFHRIMERSEYVNSGDQQGPEQKAHFSLKLKAYVHFTSPIRRFIDLVVHRMLIASLENLPCPYEARELANITHNCSSRAMHAQRFSKESKSLQLALKLKEAPLQLLTFVETLSDSGLKLLFPHRPYILPTQCKLGFNILKPSKRPETTAASESVDLAWKTRIYDVKLEGHQRHGHRKDPIELDNRRHIVHIPEDNWEDIRNSAKTGDHDSIRRAIGSAINSGGQELRQCMDQMRRFNEQSSIEVTCEYVDMMGKQQYFIDFCRSFRKGDVNQVQLHARLFKGVLTPHVQLFNMTPHLDVCAEHRDQPVHCFSDVATRIPGREKSIAEYKKSWLPILSMISAYSAVNSDDTVTIHSVVITWNKLEGNRYQGYFNLPLPFLEQRFVRIAGKPPKKEKGNEDEEDYPLDFICVRYKDLRISTRKHLKMRELDRSSKNQETIGPYNRRAWTEQTFVAHGYSTDVQTDKTAQLRTITFQLHTTSIPFPEDKLLYQHEGKQITCTIEIIPKSPPDQRVENSMRKLEDTTPLIRNICLRKPCKADDGVFNSDEITKTALKEGGKVKDLHVQETRLNPLNKPQTEAVKMALKSTFSIIQGPPGTGKTVTGAYLAYFFTQVNEKVPAMGKGRPQILYCGPSNKAVDVISMYLKKFNISIVRVYSESMIDKVYPIPGMPSSQFKWQRNQARIDDRLDDVSLHKLIRKPGAPYAEEIRATEANFRRISSTTVKEARAYRQLIDMAEAEELRKHSVVLCTCNVAGTKRIIKHTNIIQCIVDEAGMCNEPETLVPLTSTLPHQVVLIGDHKQLRPIITEPNARDLGMEESLLAKYKRKARMLTIQYRMHDWICSFPSDTFYESKLETDLSVKSRSPDPVRAIWPNRGQTPTVFCHVYGKEETLTVKSDEGNEMSKGNMAEVMHATRIVNQLMRKGAQASNIVVLSQYKLQCTQIEERLKVMDHNGVKVSTVVTSQGSEWDYVVLSTVRSMPQIEIDDKPSRGWQRKHLGFIMDENQMNVALTRAKRGLIIIGNQHLLETHPRWRDLLKKYRDQDCVMEARRFPPFGY
nr:helicase with zinc finger domain 2-like [Lytechinus pictus]